MKLLVATRSAHKVGEIREILAGVPDLELLDLDQAGVAKTAAEDDLEPYDTFEENAISKARYYHGLTGLATVADDSGLEVDALGGAPGVLSKRFAPGDGLEGLERDLANNRFLVSKLKSVPPERRGARYVCVAALVEAGRAPSLYRGEASGRIADEPRGQGGFGYDPHVVDPVSGKSYAELSAEEKNGRSHRGRAFAALGAALRARLG
ncbi:MAG: non-canonical purine NTP pyrophosphatase [Longimicrobiales bacterium]